MLLGVSKILLLEWLPLIGLAGTFAVELHLVFHAVLMPPIPAFSPLAAAGLVFWFSLRLFALFPIYVSLRTFARQQLFRGSPSRSCRPRRNFLLMFCPRSKWPWPNSVMGLLPGAFCRCPRLLSLVVVFERKISATEKAQTHSNWPGSGGRGIVFLSTLIFPVQFEPASGSRLAGR